MSGARRSRFRIWVTRGARHAREHGQLALGAHDALGEQALEVVGQGQEAATRGTWPRGWGLEPSSSTTACRRRAVCTWHAAGLRGLARQASSATGGVHRPALAHPFDQRTAAPSEECIGDRQGQGRGPPTARGPTRQLLLQPPARLVQRLQHAIDAGALLRARRAPRPSAPAAPWLAPSARQRCATRANTTSAADDSWRPASSTRSSSVRSPSSFHSAQSTATSR